MAFGRWISTTKIDKNKSSYVVINFKYLLIYWFSLSLVAVFFLIAEWPLPRTPWPWWAIFNQILKKRYKATIYSSKNLKSSKSACYELGFVLSFLWFVVELGQKGHCHGQADE